MTAIRILPKRATSVAVMTLAVASVAACSSTSKPESSSTPSAIVVNAHNASDEQYLADLLADRDTQEKLAKLALTRSTDAGIRRAANQILTPDPQFVVMQGWATEWAHDHDGPNGHGEPAAKSLSEQLAALPRTEFDRAWIRESFRLAERIAHTSAQIQVDGENAQVKSSAAHQRQRAEALLPQLGELSAG